LPTLKGAFYFRRLDGNPLQCSCDLFFLSEFSVEARLKKIHFSALCVDAKGGNEKNLDQLDAEGLGCKEGRKVQNNPDYAVVICHKSV
jgi:hypothetical protein